MHPEWQPIETAPDNENILCWGNEMTEPNKMRRCAYNRKLVFSWSNVAPYHQPTHWMPLPAPPKGER